MIKINIPKYPKPDKAAQFELLLAFFQEYERITEAASNQTLSLNPGLWGNQVKASRKFRNAVFEAVFGAQLALTEELLNALSPSPCRHDLRGDSTISGFWAGDGIFLRRLWCRNAPVTKFFHAHVYTDGKFSRALFEAAAEALLAATAKEAES